MSTSPARPEISVVLPAYNAERYVEEAVESIILQTFTDFELICVNDGSTDRTEAILKDFERRDERVRVISQANGGIVAALNAGLTQATAPLVARMDADDRSLEDRFEVQRRAFRDPSVVLVSCFMHMIDEDGEVTGVHQAPHERSVADFQLLFHNSIGGHSQVMYRREAALLAGAYRNEEALAEDYGLWCRLSNMGVVHVIPDTLHQYRSNSAGLSQTHGERQRLQAVGVARQHLLDAFGIEFDESTVEALQSFWKAGRTTPLPPAQLGLVRQRLPQVLDRYCEVRSATKETRRSLEKALDRQYRTNARAFLNALRRALLSVLGHRFRPLENMRWLPHTGAEPLRLRDPSARRAAGDGEPGHC